MAKKVKFPLRMNNGADVRTIEELRENFDLESVLEYYASGKLVTWLCDRYYDVEAEKVSNLNADSSSFKTQLCEILGVNIGDDVSEEVDLEYVKRRNEKKHELCQLTSDPEIIKNIDSVAFNQDDLIDALDSGAQTIYLCKGKFTIPLSVPNITYIGLNDPIVIIRATDNVNFKEKNIKFVDTLFGWDVSSVTPNDKMYQAERCYMICEYEKAEKLLKELVETNNPRAIVLLCNLYDAIRINSKACNELRQLGNSIGEIFSVIEYSDGDIYNLPLLEELSKSSDPIALHYHAVILNNALNQGEKALKMMEEAATLGFVQSQYNTYLLNKFSGKKAEGEKWLMLSVKNQHAKACNELGCIEFAAGNLDRAMEYHEIAANKGFADAMCNMGIYNEEKGDYNTGFKWQSKAAENGCERAHFIIGNYYLHGWNGELDYDKALEEYMKVENKDGDVMNQIGYTYEQKGNYSEAVKWYRRGAENGCSASKNQLGACYVNALGVNKDIDLAKKLFWEAYSEGIENAKGWLESLGETVD